MTVTTEGVWRCYCGAACSPDVELHPRHASIRLAGSPAMLISVDLFAGMSISSDLTSQSPNGAIAVVGRSDE